MINLRRLLLKFHKNRPVWTCPPEEKEMYKIHNLSEEEKEVLEILNISPNKIPKKIYKKTP